MRRRAAWLLLVLIAATATTAADERDDLLEEVRTALERPPGAETNRRAAALVIRVLSLDAQSDDDAFALAMQLRERLLEELDLETGTTFFVELREIYPHDERIYRSDLARLFLEAGRPAAAAAEYRALVRIAPEEAGYALAAAEALDRLGDADASIAACEAAVRRTGSAHAYRHLGLLLWRHGRGRDAVTVALTNAATAAERLPRGEREAFLAELGREREAHRKAVAHRRAVAEHLQRLDRSLLAVGIGWLVLLTVCGVVLRRRGWL